MNHRSTRRNPAGQRAIPPATRNGDPTGPGKRTPAVPTTIRSTPISGGSSRKRTWASDAFSSSSGGLMTRNGDPPGCSG